MALEFLTEEQRKRIEISQGPLVEGALVAVALVSAGADFDHVCNESSQALESKKKHLENEEKTFHEFEQEGKSVSFCFKIKNKQGVHARPAAQLVKIATQFSSQVYLQSISQGIRKVNGKSINQVLSLGVNFGEEVIVTCVGEDSHLALESLKELIFNNFGEEEEELQVQEEKPQKTQGNGEFFGTCLFPGYAEGPVYLLHNQDLEISRYTVNHPFKEWTRLENALNIVKANLAQIHFQAKHLKKSDLAIIDAQLLSLEDPVLLDCCGQFIFMEKLNAETALLLSIKEVLSEFKGISDYFKERAGDLHAIIEQVLRVLLTKNSTFAIPQEPSILIANDLAPLEVGKLNPQIILGVVLAAGSQTSHSSILLRSMGIPSLIGVGMECLQIPPNTALFLDSFEGVLSLRVLNKKVSQATKQRKELPLHVMANIRDVHGAHQAMEFGADGIGLLRTELLFMESLYETPEENQYAIYSEIASTMKGRPVFIRTFDVGGDKDHPVLLNENNPFLGLRGIRYSLYARKLFKVQIRAILRACSHGNIWLTLPMVSTLDEVLEVKALINETAQELGVNKVPPFGIVIEVPSSAILIEHFIAELDFIDIGTNDLTQYTLAVDRTNLNVSKLYDPLEPSVLFLIRKIIEVAKAHKVHVSVCGEFAGNPKGFYLFSSLGVDACSVSPYLIPSLYEWYQEGSDVTELWQCRTKDEVISFFQECGV